MVTCQKGENPKFPAPTIRNCANASWTKSDAEKVELYANFLQKVCQCMIALLQELIPVQLLELIKPTKPKDIYIQIQMIRRKVTT